MPLTLDDAKEMISEIADPNEVGRRSMAKRRHAIYKDGGKAFLIEQIIREFGQSALKEMRLAPLNLLKKIVMKRAMIFRKPPTRTAVDPQDQPLVDYYTSELDLNEVMQKANRYFVLLSNTVIYTRPKDGKLISTVVPSYLYSVKSDVFDRSKIIAYAFNSFLEGDRTTPQDNVPSATGSQSFTEERGFTTGRGGIDSNERETGESDRQFIFWSDEGHFTLDSKGELVKPDGDDDQDDENTFDRLNPIGILPVVNVCKDRDNEAWATQGEDMVDLTMSIQMGWTDLLTIAKHQGFAILTVTGPEEPKQLNIGINKAIFLKQEQNGPTPQISYVNSSSPLAEYKDLLMELLALLLTTNDLDPGSVGGKNAVRNFTSGFHAMIAMSDNLEAIEMDKPILLKAEKAHWEIIKRWHNLLVDSNSLKDTDAKKLGKFSEGFKLNIQFADAKPIESEDDVLNRVNTQRANGLMTRKDALQKLHPDMSGDQIDQKAAEIDGELSALRAGLMASIPQGTDLKAADAEINMALASLQKRQMNTSLDEQSILDQNPMD